MWTVWQISVARFLYNYSSRFQKFVEHMIYKNKIFCQAMDINNQSSKEIFMGDIQGSTRMCTVWHYPFVIEPLSHFGQQSVQAILSAISQKLEFTSKRTIHQATEEKVVISFSWHQDAIQAFRLRNRTSSLYINGVPYHFNMDTSKEYMPRVVADYYDYSIPKEFASVFLFTCS
ncbi:hypothetical protein CFC21_069192 [Triticum aestivum]|uniref:Uncharacterized protein n=2 Tax=Triticum aestivum TaxID=4565 RepID=A0A9R1KQH4_WHEAT|nr:hypothetical protein CFC21_069192 [Triticum aestivum]